MSNPFKIKADDTRSGGGGEMPPAGNHPANLVGLIDLGTHDEEYEGRPYKARKVLFCWELSAEIRTNGEPHIIVADYTLPDEGEGAGKKSKLRLMLEAWRGRSLVHDEELDLSVLVGKQALLNVGIKKSKKGNDFAAIVGVGPVPKTMTVPKPFHSPVQWYFGTGPFSPPEWLPYLYGEPVGDVISSADEAKGRVIPAVATNGHAEATAQPVAVGADEDDRPPF